MALQGASVFRRSSVGSALPRRVLKDAFLSSALQGVSVFRRSSVGSALPRPVLKDAFLSSALQGVSPKAPSGGFTRRTHPPNTLKRRLGRCRDGS